jgi:hypothetical protein
VRVESLRVAHEIVRPLRGEQIELHHEVEELVRLPFGVGKSLVARRGRDCRHRLLSGKPARCRTPEIEIALGHPGLQVRGTVIVRQPVLGNRGERLDHLGHFGRLIVLQLAALARFQIGRQRLAAALERLGEVHRESFGVEFPRRLIFNCHVIHGKDTTDSFRCRHREIASSIV